MFALTKTLTDAHVFLVKGPFEQLCLSFMPRGQGGPKTVPVPVAEVVGAGTHRGP